MTGLAPNDEVTVVLRGIAPEYTQEDIKHILDTYGLRGKFAYVSTPRQYPKNVNLGYAFVRFRSPQYVMECNAAVSGRVFGPVATSKTCYLQVSDKQETAEELAWNLSQKFGDARILFCNDPIPATSHPPTAARVLAAGPRMPSQPASPLGDVETSKHLVGWAISDVFEDVPLADAGTMARTTTHPPLGNHTKRGDMVMSKYVVTWMLSSVFEDALMP